jgi:primase-polymerase (primpol)-like protein
MEPPADQIYDDCEGEGYQCIGEDEESNIYEDVKLVTLRTPDNAASIRYNYESINSGDDRLMTANDRGSLDSAITRTSGTSSASSSIGNRSCCYQSYTLYDGGSMFDYASVSRASTGNIWAFNRSLD